MSRIISFSLWGNNKLYSDGAILNVKEARDIYPSFKCRFYCDPLVPIPVMKELLGLGADVVCVEPNNGWSGLFTRYRIMSDKNVEVVLFRDTDSVVNYREQAAVEEWLKSDYMVHGMRDHIEHNVSMMGGLIGFKKPYHNIYSFVKEMRDWENSHEMVKGTDQVFLHEKIWPKVRENIMVHDRYEGRIFRLKSGELIKPDQLAFYTQDTLPGFPEGKVEFKDGRVFKRLDLYEYYAQHWWGVHCVKPFPNHKPMKFGHSFCGEYLVQ